MDVHVVTGDVKEVANEFSLTFQPVFKGHLHGDEALLELRMGII